MERKKIKFKIVTPERTVFEADVEQATLPVTDGEVTILPGHRAYLASLRAGEIIVKQDGQEVNLATAGGFLEFNQDNLVVLADRAERADEINLERAEKAKQLAEELKLQKIGADEADYARVAAAIEKESARIKVARKHHTRSGLKID